MEGKKPSPANDPSPSSPAREGSRTSSSELLDMLLQAPSTKQQAQGEFQKELTASELLNFLSRQEAPGPNITPGGSHSMQNKYTNQVFQSVSIDQCDINSTVDYSSRDYCYRPSNDTSEAQHKSNELDGLYKTGSDTRENWWDGSLYY